MGTLFLRLQLEMGPPFYIVIWAAQRSSCLQGKGGNFISQFFKTPSIGPAPGIEPLTSHSAIRHSTDWANPAVDVNQQTIIFVYFHPLMVITVFIKLIIISPNINKYAHYSLYISLVTVFLHL